MATERRTDAARSLKELGFTGSGPFEAIVVSHLDPNYMGSLRVDLLRKNNAGSLPERVGSTIEVKYLSPFYGVTNYNNTTANDGYENTQKSYGMWFVPPDAGSKVLVTFAEGDISRGYWIGCIQDQYMNFMLPDGRASTELTTNGTPGDLKGKKLPVGEYNKKIAEKTAKDPTAYLKPFNEDFVTSLQTQGLIDDENRGTTTSSARREVPSSVFGISTPGPIDKRQGALRGLYGEASSKANVFVNRLGGFSFVMDDGDDKFIRKTPASEGPPEYASIESGDKKGERTIPHNEILRLRTRTGHQILMHNSEDLIYIGNSRGTSWIELSSNGKIDIYANDSISVHSSQDLNFTADRDVNIEAGRNMNMRARGRDDVGGNVQIESKKDTNILAEENMKIDVKKSKDVNVVEDYRLTSGKDCNVNVSGQYLVLADSAQVKASANINLDSGAVLNGLGASGVNIESGGGPLNVLSGAGLNLNGSGPVNILGPLVAIDSIVSLAAGAAGPAGPAETAQEAFTASEVEPLLVHTNTQVVPSDLSTITVESIVKRMPSHEPWLQHENLAPTSVTPEKTDITIEEAIADAKLIKTLDTFRKSVSQSSDNSSNGNNAASSETGGDSLGLPTS